MCDPITAIGALSGLIGAAGSLKKPPAAKIPAADIQNAGDEDDAEVVLNNDVDEAPVVEDEPEKKTSASGLNTKAKVSGLNIL